ncbi:acyltransferase family protein [Pseudonocardia thermophila]|jgi:hypothetical protein|uniref:acyltransferase family protein n=1 Tax=Pseudonocardia thermophila TaxID=1848 RepID=UPI00248DCE9A|nr:acyltransferase [Pseudonocardia thermophila]
MRPRTYPHLDTVRTALVAWVIAGHALLGYSAVGGWAYDEVHEVTFAPPTELMLAALLGPSGLFVIGTLFFVSGMLAESSLQRHGPRGYVSARAVRLGLPWLVSALLVWPAAVWLAYTADGRGVTFWWVLTHRDPLLDSGSLWFALVLLMYCAAFAAWYAVRPVPRREGSPLTGRRVARVVVLIAAASFAVRLVFPARSGQLADLHLWQWPQCAGMFLFGIAAARRGWAGHVPDGIRRGCGLAAGVTLVVLPGLALATGLRDTARDMGPYLGGWHWQSACTAVVEALLVVAGSLWLVGIAERRERAPRWSRGAYVAFVVQGPVLLAFAVALRPLPAPAELKAPVLAVGAVVVCFALGVLVTGSGRTARAARDVRPHLDAGSRTSGRSGPSPSTLPAAAPFPNDQSENAEPDREG